VTVSIAESFLFRANTLEHLPPDSHPGKLGKCAPSTATRLNLCNFVRTGIANFVKRDDSTVVLAYFHFKNFVFPWKRQAYDYELNGRAQQTRV
jgi:hypothetical protein